MVKVYKGNSSSYSDVICNVDGSKIYKGNSSSYSDVICNVDGSKIYKGNSSSYSDVICNISNDKVYKGNSSSYSDVILNISSGKNQIISYQLNTWIAISNKKKTADSSTTDTAIQQDQNKQDTLTLGRRELWRNFKKSTDNSQQTTDFEYAMSSEP